MAAVKKLRDPGFFRSHAFGGIVKVTIPPGPWYERTLWAQPEWDTPAYDASQFEVPFGELERTSEHIVPRSTRVILENLITNTKTSVADGLSGILERMMQRV
jgi:hypothetical protein